MHLYVMEQKKENMNAKTSLSITYMYIRFDLDSRKLLSVLPNLFIIAHSAVSYYSHSYNYLVVAVVVAEAQNMHF